MAFQEIPLCEARFASTGKQLLEFKRAQEFFVEQIVAVAIDQGVDVNGNPIYPPASDVQLVVNTYLLNALPVSLGGSSTATVSVVDTTIPGGGIGSAVTVGYTYRFLVLPNFVNSLTGTIALTGLTTMRKEGQ